MNANDITIYHNPDCGTSRNTLALIRASGIEPTVIEYLKAPPDLDTLRSVIARTGMAVRDVLRVRGTPYNELGLDAPDLTDEHLLKHMLAHPILINRPLVVTPLGANLCRPSDVVLDLLARRPAADSLKEDGSPFLADMPANPEDPTLRAALSAADLPTEDLTEPGRRLYTYRTPSGERVGYGGFERYGHDVLLRSITVLSRARNRGIGGGILALLLRRAFDQGARQAWLLTTTATGFFEKAGFKPVERATAPTTILATRQAASLCPSSAVLLKRSVTL